MPCGSSLKSGKNAFMIIIIMQEVASLRAIGAFPFYVSVFHGRTYAMKRSFIIFLYKIAYRLNRIRRMTLRPLTLGVKIMLVRDEQVLMVQHTYQPGWFIPGGGVKRGETLEEAARREAWEELGAKLEEVTLFGMYSNIRNYKNEHVAVFMCDSFTLSDKQDYEIAESAFFPIDAPPAGTDKGSRYRLHEYSQALPNNEARVW